MKFLLENSLASEAEDYLAGHEWEAFDTASMTRERFLEAAREIDALGFRWQFPFPLDRVTLEQLPNLKHIHKSGAGLEHAGVMDLAALGDLGILFTNNIGINAGSVAEHAVMLAVMALRPSSFAQMAAMREGRWEQRDVAGQPPAKMVAGRTLGIVGMGAIGTAVARIMKPMGVRRILGYRRSGLSGEAAELAEFAPLDDLLRQSDLVLLCLPINAATTGLIDAEKLALMDPETTLVNVGRGGVIDEPALYAALTNGRLRAAGLDVLAEEPSDSPLMRLPNVFATPHVAAYSPEVFRLQITGSLEALAAFGARKIPPRLYDPALLAAPQLRASWLAQG